MIDGDQVMAVIAESWRDEGRLANPGIVATVMSNLGLERHLAGLGLTLERTAVGDRYVIERMREKGYNVGGEQSGHIILSDYSTTGDGLVSALQVLAVVHRLGKPVSEVCRRFEPLPQVLRNVRFNGGKPLENPAVTKAIADADRPARRSRTAHHSPFGHRAGHPGDGRSGRTRRLSTPSSATSARWLPGRRLKRHATSPTVRRTNHQARSSRPALWYDGPDPLMIGLFHHGVG